MIKIEIWSDFSCPFCYIGKTRLENVIKNNFSNKDIIIEMKAYQLNPDAPEVAKTDIYTYFSQMRGVSLNDAKNMFLHTINTAKTLNLNFDYDIMKMTNTYKAHRLAKYARTKNIENELSKLLMSSYFEKGIDINNNDELIKISKELKLNEKEVIDILNSNSFKDVVDNEINEAKSFQITGVPFFVINRKYGISGAQSEQVFINAIEQVLKEEPKFKPLGDSDDTCGIDGC